MILWNGKVLPNDKQNEVIDGLKEEIIHTLSFTSSPTINEVIEACGTLYDRFLAHSYDEIALPLLNALNLSPAALEHYSYPFSRDGLKKKVETELGALSKGPLKLDKNNERERYPLGVLFHIAAGNVDLLPAFSVIEGLLAGNINLLKLPTGDNGLSVKLLSELIKIGPNLAPYIYVFDVPSIETETIKKLSSLADATIVWGGEEAEKAARDFVDVHSHLIVWGHKISFAYVDSSVSDAGLKELSKSICLTNGLFCSSAQGIYFDTDDKDELEAFGKRFIEIFASTSKMEGAAPLTMRAKNSLSIYNDKLEGKPGIILTKDEVSTRILPGDKLELSYLFRDVWIKALPRQNIIKALKENRKLLQTAAVEVNPLHYKEVSDSFSKAGITRIVKLGDSSRMIAGESHDGEYPLMRYSRIVERYLLK